MNIKEIEVHDNVLVQPDADTRERARIVDIDYKRNKVVVRLSDYEFREMDPQFVLKSFGQTWR